MASDGESSRECAGRSCGREGMRRKVGTLLAEEQ